MKYRNRMKKEKCLLAKTMRKNPTPAERHFWSLVCAKQIGWKWRRQNPMLGYFADFYCPSLKLVVELDGSSHVGREKYDRQRDSHFRKYGFMVLRLTNDYAMQLTLESLKELLANAVAE